MIRPSIDRYISPPGGGAPVRRLRCLLRLPGFTRRACPIAPTRTATKTFSDLQSDASPPQREGAKSILDHRNIYGYDVPVDRVFGSLPFSSIAFAMSLNGGRPSNGHSRISSASERVDQMGTRELRFPGRNAGNSSPQR